MEVLQNYMISVYSQANGAISFTSVAFIVFFTVLYAVFALSPSRTGIRNKLLLIFSLYFYYRLTGPGIILLLVISASDYLAALFIHRSTSERKKTWLLCSAAFIDLGCLVYFKYANFFLSQAHAVLHPETIFLPVSLIVPAGISYYVFKSLGYVIDVYRGTITEPENEMLVYLLYTSFFPTIIAGPVSRARELLPQFHKESPVTDAVISKGLFFILAGIFKKVFIADFIATNFLDRLLESPGYFSGFENLIALFAAPIQVYCDFSGYTDMALGFAMLFGIEIKNNFNAPFQAKSVTEFWRRWHITLLDWFTEYLFSPVNLVLRRWGKASTVIAIMITFLVSGLWHGAAWTFIVWGCLHGLMLVLEYFTASWRTPGRKRGFARHARPVWPAVSFLFIAASFIIFKSTSLASAGMVFGKILSGFDLDIIGEWFTIYSGVFFMMSLGYMMHFLPQKYHDALFAKFSRVHWAVQAAVIAVGFYIIYQTVAVDTKPFIYLEF